MLQNVKLNIAYMSLYQVYAEICTIIDGVMLSVGRNERRLQCRCFVIVRKFPDIRKFPLYGSPVT